jgi:hypothetical protein
MQKWEYCEAELTIGGPLTSGFVVTFFKEGSEPKDTWSGGYSSGMAQLGKLGWELVSSSARTGAGLTSTHKINMLFKRPLEDKPEQ